MSHKIGVDGGATKTECILVDGAGQIVARHLAAGCSPSVLGPAAAGQIMAEALALLRSQSPGPIAVTLLCLAGNREFWREFAAAQVGFGRVLTCDDSLPVLELATGGQPGLVLHGGTGSFVAARTGPASRDSFGAVHYAGGLGWRFGDPGSGHDLGRRAIGRALLELQGWMPASGLGPLVCRHTGLTDPREISRSFYTETGPDPRVAALAPGVLGLADGGDEAAVEIVGDSAVPLLDLAVRVAVKLFPGQSLRSLRAGLSGPILTHPAVLEILLGRTPFDLAPVREPAIEGVRRMVVADR